MAPKKQRSYPWLDSVAHQPTKESLRLLWDLVHEHSDRMLTVDTINAASETALTELQAKIDKLTKQITIISAGGGISTPSSVGGGGSSGSSGGSGPGTPGGGGGSSGGGQGGGPNQDTWPNQQGVVQQAIDDLTAALVPLGGYCGCFEIAKLVAWRLMSSQPQIGLASAKPGSSNNCDGYTTDVIVYLPTDGSNDLVVYDIATDSGGATHNAVWSFAGTMSISRYQAPIPPAI